MDSKLLADFKHLLRPHATKVANMVARAVVQLVSDAKKLQILQVGALADEDVPDAEHHQPYGFSSVPLNGAEAILVFPNGDRAHPLAIAVSDRRYRPRGGQAGEVVMYTDEGDQVRLGRGHVITLATSGTVKLGSSLAAEGAIKGNTFATAAGTFLTALAAWAALVGTATGLGGATSTLATAITAFANAITASVSAKVKLE